jgi:hypothetical protein
VTGSSNATNSGARKKDITSLGGTLLEDVCDIDFGDSETCSAYRRIQG